MQIIFHFDNDFDTLQKVVEQILLEYLKREEKNV